MTSVSGYLVTNYVYNLPFFSVVEMQPTIWWQTGQSHVSEHKTPKVGCLHVSVQLIPKVPAGHSSEWKKDHDKIEYK